MVEIGDCVFQVGEASFCYRPVTKEWYDGRGETKIDPETVPETAKQQAKAIKDPVKTEQAAEILSKLAAGLANMGLNIRDVLEGLAKPKAEEPPAADVEPTETLQKRLSRK